MKVSHSYSNWLILIIVVNFVVKAVVASVLELGNDEVYYWTYALYPDISHFDHPPMVGWLIQLTTANLKVTHEFFIRLGSLLLSSVGIWLVYRLASRIGSERTGIVAALFYTASPYLNIISGLMIMPDTPQVILLLAATYLLLTSVTSQNPSGKEDLRIIVAGLLIGLAFLSKYHSLITWFGTLLYLAIHNRKWFLRPSLYLSGLLTAVMMLPVLYWNDQNNFISFAFHGERVDALGLQFNAVAFMQFILGQFIYQNPLLVLAMIWALVQVYKRNKVHVDSYANLLVYISLPFILIFLAISAFRFTLPHWSGPGFIGLVVLTAKMLTANPSSWLNTKRIAIASNLIILLVLIFGPIVVNSGLPFMQGKVNKNDVTLDMYGWHQLSPKLDSLLKAKGIDPQAGRVAIIASKWFPAAHIDFYYAQKRNINLFALGPIDQIHKYWWINKMRGPLCNHSRFFYVTSFPGYKHSSYLINDKYFTSIQQTDTIRIYRKGKVVKTFEITELKGCLPQKSDTLQP